MMNIYPYETLGHADHGWLNARHHFSFGMYHNPKRRGFGDLLVINDDIVAPGRGFATHPHDNMEIITYVREGAITHRDSMENQGRTGAGDVQVMSAGTGIFHSEVNAESVPTRLYQIWIRPHTKGVPPRWEAREFPKVPRADALHLLVSGQKEHDGQGALFIHADAAIYGGVLPAGSRIAQAFKHQAYVLVSRGSVKLDGAPLKQGDGAEVFGQQTLTIEAEGEAEVLVIDAPAHVKQ